MPPGSGRAVCLDGEAVRKRRHGTLSGKHVTVAAPPTFASREFQLQIMHKAVRLRIQCRLVRAPDLPTWAPGLRCHLPSSPQQDHPRKRFLFSSRHG
eukprot:4349169-Pyramimonas_sp.AAC.1